MEYLPTIGLEVHAELKTKTKMFCACKNDSDEKRPNINICPVCMGHPGTLPVANKEALKHILRVGSAVHGKEPLLSEFDRKNYFYPDIPKGYQISQYKTPLIAGGELAGIALTRIHIEEDTAKSSHEENGDEEQKTSLVDFNRAGVPLMELVTEPVIHEAKEISRFGQELQILLQYLGVASANMEKGEMRLEANVSVGKDGKLGTKVEIKNLNSFRSAERAAAYEIKRQTELLESGGVVSQETRGWDEKKQVTFTQRSKEDSHDYRYFPDPDLPKMKLSLVEGFDSKDIASEVKETPDQKRKRYKEDYGIKESDIEFFILNRTLSDLFEQTANIGDKLNLQLLSNYVVSDIASFGDKASNIIPKNLYKLISMYASGSVSSRGVKEVLAKMLESTDDPMDIAEKNGFLQKNDTAELEVVAKEIVADNKAVVEEYKNGKSAAIQFLIGLSMKATKGSANPQVMREIFERVISESN